MHSVYVTRASATFPKPKVFVGVLTEIKIRSASWIAGSMSAVKNKFLPLHSFTTSSSPGYITHIKVNLFSSSIIAHFNVNFERNNLLRKLAALVNSTAQLFPHSDRRQLP